MAKKGEAEFPFEKIEVEWEDASSGGYGGWWEPDMLDEWEGEPYMIMTRGYLVRKAKTHLIVAASVDLNNPEPKFNGLIKIPTKYIRKVRKG